MRASFWNNHYKDFRVREPSDFARRCAAHHLRKDDQLIELGCGNGRDGVMFAQQVARYTGIDACPIAIEAFSQGIAKIPAMSNVTLNCDDFTAINFDALAGAPGRLAIYSRFTLHSISYAESDRLFENLEKFSSTSWIFMLEARTIYDELYGVGKNIGPHEFQTDHYRRFIDPAAFLEQLGAKFAIKYFEVSNGFARFADQDPVLMRAVFCHKGVSLKAL